MRTRSNHPGRLTPRLASRGPLILCGLFLSVLAGLGVLWRLSQEPSNEERFAAALDAIDRNDERKALEILDVLLERDSSFARARLYRGQLLSERGDAAAAVRDWRAIPDAPAPLGGTARYLEGLDLLRRGRARDGERLLRRAVEINPRYLPARERLLELYVSQRRREATRATLAGIRGLRPWRLEECAMHALAGAPIASFDDGAARMEAYAETDPEDAESRVALCRFLIDADRSDQAIARLRPLLKSETAGPHAAALLASVLLDRGNVAEAGKVLGGRTFGTDSPASLWAAAGRHAAENGNQPAAVDRYRAATQLDPFDVTARHALGLALARSGDPTAEAVLQDATRLDRIERQAFLIIRGLDRHPALLAATAVEIAEELEALALHETAAAWFEQALARSPGDQRAVAGLRRSREALSRPDLGGADRSRLDAERDDASVRVSSNAVRPSADSRKPAEIRFRDDGPRAGIDFTFANGPSGSKYILETIGGGVVVLDYDLDDRPDLFFPQGGIPGDGSGEPQALDRLYRNCGNGTFLDVSRSTGVGDDDYSLSATAADYDGDGFADLAVANFGQNIFYRNNGDGTFADRTDETGIRERSCSSAMAFADFDGDGLPDLYIVNYVADPFRVCRNRDGALATCDPQNYEWAPDRVFRNRGDGAFEDATSAAGVVDLHGKGLGIVTADLDGDGRCDVYVANDGSPNFLFLNASDGPGHVKFVEAGLPLGAATDGEGRSQAGMGVACADFDGDGTPDLYVTNFYKETNTLYLNSREGVFRDATKSSGHAGPTKNLLGFGTQAADFDLDGLPDLAVANGDIDDYSASGRPWKMNPLLFNNTGGGRFVEIGETSGDYFAGRYLGRGMARLDWNRDGRPDLAVVHYDRPVALLTNVTERRGRTLVLELHGVESDRDATGAAVRVTADGRTQYVPVCGGDGYAASNERRIVVGVGSASQVERLEVTWPGGKRESASDVPTNSTVRWVEGRKSMIRPDVSHRPAKQNARRSRT